MLKHSCVNSLHTKEKTPSPGSQSTVLWDIVPRRQSEAVSALYAGATAKVPYGEAMRDPHGAKLSLQQSKETLIDNLNHPESKDYVHRMLRATGSRIQVYQIACLPFIDPESLND